MTSRLLFAVALLIIQFCVSGENARKKREQTGRFGNAMLDEPDYLNVIPPPHVQLAYRGALCQRECQPAFQKIERLHICVMESVKYEDDCRFGFQLAGLSCARRCIIGIVPAECDTLRKALVTSASEKACPDGLSYQGADSSAEHLFYHPACVMLTLILVFLNSN